LAADQQQGSWGLPANSGLAILHESKNMNHVLGICFDQKSFYVSIFCALFGNLKNKIMALKCFWSNLVVVGELVFFSYGW
jgi:hypothetical protein